MAAFAVLQVVDPIDPTSTTKMEPKDADPDANEGLTADGTPSTSRGPPKKKVKTEGNVKADPNEQKRNAGKSSLF